MTLIDQIRGAVAQVGFALRRPEEFALEHRDVPYDPLRPALTVVFIVNAVFGLAAYGLTMGLHGGVPAMLSSAAKAPLAAGLAWAVGLPALYILNSALGSKLDAGSTFLAALTTVAFGALAMLASVPIQWFFSMALPYPLVRFAVNAVIFAGVGVAMADTFLRVMRALEPERSRAFAFVWLCLLAVIGVELMTLLNLFS
jgi:hypothetical protein